MSSGVTGQAWTAGNTEDPSPGAGPLLPFGTPRARPPLPFGAPGARPLLPFGRLGPGIRQSQSGGIRPWFRPTETSPVAPSICRAPRERAASGSGYRGLQHHRVLPGWTLILHAPCTRLDVRLAPQVTARAGGRRRAGLRDAEAEGRVDRLYPYPHRLRLRHAEPFEDVQRLPEHDPRGIGLPI